MTLSFQVLLVQTLHATLRFVYLFEKQHREKEGDEREGDLLPVGSLSEACNGQN